MGDMFLRKTSENAENKFPPSCTYMCKIPKDNLRCLLKEVFGKTETFFKGVEKQKKGTTYRILCRAAQLDENSKNPWLNVDEWTQQVTDRASKVPKCTLTVVNGAIDWDKTGWFKLLPALPANTEDPSTHKYTEVTAFGKKAPLPTYLNIFADWDIQENWSLHTAYVVMHGKNRKTGPWCRLFSCFGTALSDHVLPALTSEGDDGAEDLEGGAPTGGAGSHGAAPVAMATPKKKSAKLGADALKKV